MSGCSNTFGLMLKGWRARRGWSLSVAAGHIGCTKAHLWELESDRSRNPSLQLLVGIGLAYGVPISDVATSAAPAVLAPEGTEDGRSNRSGIDPEKAALRQRVRGLEEALRPLLAQFDVYRESGGSHIDAHSLLVRYPLWEAARAALSSALPEGE